MVAETMGNAAAMENAEDDPVAPAANRWPYRIGFGVVAAVVLAVILLVPVAVGSLIHEIRHPPTAVTDVLVPPGPAATDSFSVLHLDAVALDEIQRTLTLHVSGYHQCLTTCPYQDTLVFFAVRSESRMAGGLPPAASLQLPSGTAPIDTTIQLPVDGELLFYPFDRYRLVMAIGVERATQGQPTRMLREDEVEGRLVLTFQQHIPRLNDGPVDIKPQDRLPLSADIIPLGVGGATLVRPDYLQVLVILAVLLTGAVAICTVLLRPLSQLVLNTGGLILGVWGIRTLLLAGYPPDSTLVDIVLTGIIFVQLTAVAVRVLLYLGERGQIPLPTWRRRRGADAAGSDRS
ncbi:MAG: hypothetical protein WBA63_03050 [Thermomicrobiales bacterium]